MEGFFFVHSVSTPNSAFFSEKRLLCIPACYEASSLSILLPLRAAVCLAPVLRSANISSPYPPGDSAADFVTDLPREASSLPLSHIESFQALGSGDSAQFSCPVQKDDQEYLRTVNQPAIKIGT